MTNNPAKRVNPPTMPKAPVPGDFTSTQLLNAADAALYAAKRSGRGKLVVASAHLISAS